MNLRKYFLSFFMLFVLIGFMFSIEYVNYEPDNHPELPPYDNDLIWERIFDDGTCFPWHTTEDSGGVVGFEVEEHAPGDKAFRLDIIEKGENAWSCQMRHRGITIEAGHTYTVKLTIWATKDCQAYIKIGQMGDPYAEYWNNNWAPFNLTANEKLTIEQTFTGSVTDPTCEFTFHCGGPRAGNVPYSIYLDNVSLYDPQFNKPKIPILTRPDVRINQLGYFPDGKKRATVVTNSTSPIAWELLNAANQVVDSGMTTVKGFDPDTEDYVHIIDFSSFNTPGVGYKFNLPGVSSEAPGSHDFDIRTDLYSQMKIDALAYFYHNRSGIAIEMPYAGREDLTRPAGHIDVAPNTGDGAVPTWPNSGQKNYSLDVTGGWYDAGDHGKYVVNGGISVWTMMNQYEHAKLAGLEGVGPYLDGGMNIPENDNGIPDILDESRWQMEFLLKMQVPADKDPDLAGMVHHKIHDETWTALGLAPHEDPKDRYLKPVSTAATLNVAATAAQAARIWQTLDPAFSAKCLDAAEKAWTAALAHPDIYAPNNAIGGGPYNDSYVLDDFYWAACELLVTTGKDEYKNYIMASAHYLEMPSIMSNPGEDGGLYGCFTWGTTQGLGTLALALHADGLLSGQDIQSAKDNMAAACDVWLDVIEEQGYGLPIKAAGDPGNPGYPWGSNSFIVNIMIVFAYTFDFSGEVKYFNGMTESMDYLMGRNGLDQNYVTGYGERALQNPHHRFWAFQVAETWPKAPAGCFSGGPNSNFQDPTVSAAVPLDTPKQKVFIDNIDSWSTNEITINWNAPFAWVTSYLDEKAGGLEKVSITNPEAGEVIALGDNLVIEASAVVLGDISRVEFYDNTDLLGSDNTRPYRLVVASPAAGSYDLKAVALKTDGTEVESPIIPVTVKEIVKPTVSITVADPPAGQINFYEPQEVSITAAASDADGTVVMVQFLIDDVVVNEDTQAPFAYNWSSVEGIHTISAIAIDDDGAKSDPASETITIGAPKDLVVQYYCRESNPITNTIRANFNIVNKGSKSVDMNDLELYYFFTKDNDSNLVHNCHYARIGSSNVSNEFGYSDETDFARMTFNYTLDAASESGEIQMDINYQNWSNHDQTNDFSFGPDISEFTNYKKVALYKNGELIWGEDPRIVEDYARVTLTSPENGETYTDRDSITLSAIVDTNVAGYAPAVSFYDGSSLIATDNSAPYSYTIDPATEGLYALRAEIEFQGEIISSNIANITVIPFVETIEATISSPADGTHFISGTPFTITVDVVSNVDIAEVEVDGQTDYTAPYEFTITAPATVGNYTYTATAITVGGTTDTDTITIIVDPFIETIEATITSPANNTVYLPGEVFTITVNVVSNVNIERVVLDGQTDNTAPYIFSITAPKAEGTYTYTATASTVSGTTDSDSVDIIVDEQIKPVVSITAPADGAQVEGSVTITATASDADGSVDRVVFMVDGSVIETDTTAPYQATWQAASGLHTISVIAYDDENLASDEDSITVEGPQGGDVTATYSNINQWNNGFQSSIIIENNSDSAISNWKVTFTFTGNQQINNGWGGIYVQNGQRVTITPEAWNGTIHPNSRVDLGFTASYSGTNDDPVDITVTYE